MSDIFISYAREDKSRVETLAKALQDSGWSVWWDPHIPTGKRFDEVIEDALSKAKCIIVVWSKDSVASSFVRAEASDGADRQILLPVMIDEVKIPLAFRQIQTARFDTELTLDEVTVVGVGVDSLPAKAERSYGTIKPKMASVQPVM
jgi:TIR domain